MDFSDSPAESAFRAEARAWLADNAPAHLLDDPNDCPEQILFDRSKLWQREKVRGGFAAILWPADQGGRGGSPIESVIFDEEEARYPLPIGPFMTIGMKLVMPTIMTHGTPEQIARFARPTLTGDITWCQLFSEPGAGSDMAALSTRAVRVEGGWIVNGHKVWNSWAHFAEWAILIARTDASVPKHAGITYFVVDMSTPGIETRPIRQISGRSEFNEVSLKDVFIPDENRIGASGAGWSVAMTTLMNERLGAVGHTANVLTTDMMIDIARQARRGGRPALADSGVRLQLARFLAVEKALDNYRSRALTELSRTGQIDARIGIVKYLQGRRLQHMAAYAMELIGTDALIIDPCDTDALRSGVREAMYLSSALRIAGGTDEVLLNQIAERVLDMPGDVRIDKNVPFADLPT